MNRLYKLILITISVLFSWGIPLLQSETTPIQKGNFLYFHGEGKANINNDNKTQKQSLSKEAAILDGKAKIAVYIEGLKTKNILIKEAMAKDKKIELKVKAFLDGVETVESQWDVEDNCKVVLKINKKNLLKKLKVKE